MLNNKNFTIHETLEQNHSVSIYRGMDKTHKCSVIIKSINVNSNDQLVFSQFLNEQYFLNTMHSKHIVKLLDVVITPFEHIHIFEDIDAYSLDYFIKNNSLTLVEQLEIAVKVAKALEYVHKHNILHLDINPKNIIYNQESKHLQIIDFGSAIKMNYRNILEQVYSSGSLLYMSPEQTGLTQENLDLRSDLYSLGISLYHLFLGKLPFDLSNKEEIAHQQVAFVPKSLHSCDATVPLTLSKIIDKLIEKKPLQRYQSDEALIFDLQKALKYLQNKKDIPSFEIGTHNQPVITIGMKIFGREKELKLLKNASQVFAKERVLHGLISGHSGVGKTRLLEEFLNYSTNKHINYISAKFDQGQSYLPYKVMRQLFAQIYTIVMSSSKKELFKSLAQKDQAVLHFIFPELDEILEPPKKSYLSTTDINKNLFIAVESFFTLFATYDSPLLIFIDDLQWGDPSTIHLLEKLLLKNNKYLHFIGAYRDNEIFLNKEAERFINTLLNNSQDKNYHYFHLNLLPIKELSLREMMMKLFRFKSKTAEEFADICYQKTIGNPFYIKAMIETLMDKEILYFQNGNWHYKVEEIRQYSIGINLTKLVNENYLKLNAKKRKVLSFLALLGSYFDLALTFDLMQYYGFDKHLIDVLEIDGFILLNTLQYQFVHDKVHENVLDNIDQKTKQNIHLKIGKYFKNICKSKQIDSIRVAHHINLAYQGKKYPHYLFALNLNALEELLSKGAYDGAVEMSRWVEENLYDDALSTNNYSNYFRFKVLQIKSYYLFGSHQHALEEVEILLKKAKKIMDKLVCFTLYKDICVTQGNHFDSLIDISRILLHDLGLNLPRDKSILDESISGLQNSIHEHKLYKNIKEIPNLPQHHSGRHKMLISLLMNFWEVAYYLTDIQLMKWAYLNIVYHSFKYGNCSESSFGYVLYGGQLVSEQNYKEAYNFGKLALQLNQSFNDKAMLPKINNFMANFINPYYRNLHSNLNLYERSLYQSKINGDIIFGTWANFLLHLSNYLLGTPLNDVLDKITQEGHFIQNSSDLKMIAIFNFLKKNVQNLQGIQSSVESNIENDIQMWEKDKFYPALAWYGIIQAQNSWIHGDIEAGLSYLKQYVKSSDNEVIMFPKLRLHFIRALLLLAKSTTLQADEKECLETDIHIIDKAARSATSRSDLKFFKTLLDIEKIKTTHLVWDVAKAYDEILNKLHKDDNYFHISLAQLCVSRFFLSRNYVDIAQKYLNEALVSLNQWGAFALSASLKPSIKSHTLQESLTLHTTQSSAMILNSNKFNNLTKAFNGISKAQNSTELIETLLHTIIQNATATKAVLILKDKDIFNIKANIDFQTKKINFYNLLDKETILIPDNIFQYCLNTKKNIFLENPADSNSFKTDKYFKQMQPASCLAIPSFFSNEIRGVLYVENSTVHVPLSEETIKILELLLTQAVIVYQNTMLYDTLKESEKNLNKAQEIAHIGSWQFNALGKIKWSAETYRIYGLEPFSMEINYEWFLDHVHPDDREYVMQSVQRVLVLKESYDIVHRILTVHGEQRVVHQKAELLQFENEEGMSGTIKDITQSEKAKSLIRRLSQVVEQNPFATYITDKNGLIEYVNKTAIALTGYTKEEMIHQKMSLFNSGKHGASLYQDLWFTIKGKKEIWEGTLINKIKNGTLLDCKSIIFPILDKENNIEKFVSIQEDKTEENLKNRLFIMQTRQAQMGEMLSMIAHQWRQPLSVIMALINTQRIHIALDKENIEEIEQSYIDVEKQVQYLSNTISDFRDFFKPDKAMSLTQSSVYINKAYLLIKHSLKQANIVVDIKIKKDEKYLVFEHEMEQVILNIFKNAQDAFSERHINNPMINVLCDQKEKETIIIIEDNAGGIDPSVIDTIFLPYISTKSKKNGTGLGLYMSKTIVQEHCKGSLDVTNTQIGAKFTIKIPQIGVTNA